jgi:oligopeptide transport system substrate-binding protein
MNTRNITHRLRIAAAMALPAAATLGCSYLMPSPTVTPIPAATETPTPTPFSAQAYLQSVGEDAEDYPVRYYSPGGEMSFAVPSGWAFNQQKDTGHEVDSFSEVTGGQAVGAVYFIEKIQQDAGAQQAMEAFWESEGISGRSMETAEAAEFSASSGAAGWLASGTLAATSDPDNREEFLFAAFPQDRQAFLLAGYPERAVSPESFRDAWQAAALSFHWEETRTRDVETDNALQLQAEEPATLDPALSLDGAGGMLGDLYSGLVILDTSLQVAPGLAEHWDITPDGKTYTFHLRKDACFHNDRPFTADDVLFSWLRAASPDLESFTAMRYLGDILGMREYNSGERDDVPGIRIVDPHTIQVTLETSKPVFLEKIAQPAAWIVDRYTVRLPHWDLHPIGTGPFRLLQRVPEKSLILEAAPGYFGSPPQIQYVIYWITTSGQETLYKSSKIDRMDISHSQLPDVADPHDRMFGVVDVEPRLCTEFILFNTDLPPFDDPLVRKAFALSVNREVYVEVSTEEEDTPATGILPPGMPGYVPDPDLLLFDPLAADDLLSQSSYYRGSGGQPEIRLVVSSRAAEYDATTEYLVDSWEDALGIDIQVEGIAPEEYEQLMEQKPAGQMVFLRHCAQYPDPESFYDYLFHSDNAGIYYGFRNEELDLILNSASTEGDWTKRMDLYRQADRILYDESPAMAIAYPGPGYIVWKPHVLGYIPTAVKVPQHHLMWIQRE